ncbi:hypothetical protein QBC40DRAFT_11744 [Triangularia verruculosa]|uniref:Zn(2)-C6 fungal-type domain-containing protein n=1 Tax=Triangularia verruculosa TaxID=2587418 RepID=A0AAN7ARS9_9PEZI|nr:hypothetical protein QBC40DRAFT_11744 [Triangularia verruculosa]
MVYCGKPSKGCSNCRERKIRCDQREPGCGQCEKRHQTCPGYRNLVDLMFRDESSHVIKKAKARARKKGNLIVEPSTPSGSEGRLSVTPEPRGKPSIAIVVPATPAPTSPADSDGWGFDDSLLMSPESGSWPITPPAMALYNIPPVCQEQGFAFFFSRFVTANETACHQNFDFVREVWKPSRTKRERQVDSVLASLTAVGLMGMASLQRRSDLMDAARKSYGVALGLTKDALKDPTEAVKDSTMLSILILGVFEMMAESPARVRTVTAFQEHVNGAAALARIRGPAQFQTRAGRRMFSMLCQRVVISCAMKDMPMPQPLKDLWHEMAKTLEPENPTRHLMPLVWQVLQLRHDIKNHIITDPGNIVEKLLAIEHDLEKLTNNMSPSWQYRQFKVTQHHDAVFEGYCHLYPSLHHANIWNCIRTTRILILETIISQISEDFSSFTPRLNSSRYIEEYNTARRKLKRLVYDICASVPQHLGLMDPVDGSIGSQDEEDASARITTVEVRETPSPPTSPSTRSCDSSTSPSEARRHATGLTILDVTKARDEDDEAERYMLLVSATSTVVWPLYLVGMSTACSEEMKHWVVGRLRMVTMETGIKQADALAGLIADEGVGAVDWIDPALEQQQAMGTDPLLLSPDMIQHTGHDGWGNGGGLYGLGLSPLQVPMEYMGDEFGVGEGDLVWV